LLFKELGTEQSQFHLVLIFIFVNVKTSVVILSVYFFTLSLVPNFGGHELLKLPAFVIHFLEHKKENRDITLLEFLDIHYMHGNVKDKDYDRDMTLPFKSGDVCLTCSAIAFIPFSIPKFSFKSFTTVVEKLLFSEVSVASFQSLSNIWQPPKVS
jgi:hypothetical protein